MADDYRPDEERSLSRPFFILSLLLVLTALYAVVDETIVRRPWKHYQTAFHELEYDGLRSELQAKEEMLLPTQGDLGFRIADVREPERVADRRPSRLGIGRVALGLGEVAETEIDHRELVVDRGRLAAGFDRPEEPEAFDPGPDRDLEVAGQAMGVGEREQQRGPAPIVEIDAESLRLFQ